MRTWEDDCEMGPTRGILRIWSLVGPTGGHSGVARMGEAHVSGVELFCPVDTWNGSCVGPIDDHDGIYNPSWDVHIPRQIKELCSSFAVDWYYS